MAIRAESPRTVKPRKLGNHRFPILAVHEGRIIRERTGEVLSVKELPGILHREDSSLIVVYGAGRLLKWLDERIDNPCWQFRLTPIVREIYNPNNQKIRTEIRDTIVSFMGFRSPSQKKHRWHYPIDPTVILNKTVHEIYPGDEETIWKLLRWGVETRNYLTERGLQVRPTAGGIAGQLLRDPRFYPEPRRKVPRATNKRARPTLPGNFYELYCQINRPYQAHYLDQSNSHHNAARDIEFPCANQLVGLGRYWSLEAREWATGKRLESLLKLPGLFYLGMDAPFGRLGKVFPLPSVSRPGFCVGFVYSNEIPYLREIGTKFYFASAAWVSKETDKGLNSYAEWAMKELKDAPSDHKPWLKPLLLSAYGVLASKPRQREFGYKLAKNSQLKDFPVGSGMLAAFSRKTSKVIEMPTANVIHRGMIEAEARVRSVRLARDLAGHGCRVLAVYADSVFVEAGAPLPLLPYPWRVERDLDGLTFYSATSFSSRQLTRLPGIPRESLARVQRLNSLRVAAASVRQTC